MVSNLFFSKVLGIVFLIRMTADCPSGKGPRFFRCHFDRFFPGPQNCQKLSKTVQKNKKNNKKSNKASITRHLRFGPDHDTTLGQAWTETLGQALTPDTVQGPDLTRGQTWPKTLGHAQTKTLGQVQAKTLVQARARPKPFSFSSFRPRHAPGTVFVA